MVAALFGLLGMLFGPWLHSLAVAAGRDQRPTLAWQCPRDQDHHARQPGKKNGVARCSCGRWRWRELATGVMTGLAFAGMTRALGVNLVQGAHLAMVAVTAILVVTDFDHFRIPNRVLYPGGTACAALLALAAAD